MPPRHSSSEGKSSGGAGSSAAAKLRRAHRKSRKGCLECKRRHIKCDESRPSCNNCLVSERACSFPPSVGAATDASAPAQTRQAPLPVRTVAGAESLDSSALSLAGSSSGSGGVHLNPHPPEGPWVALSKILEHAKPPTLPPIRFIGQSPSSPSTTDSLPPPIFSPKHLILLHHAETGTLFSQEMLHPIIEIAITWAVEAPYVLDQLLALSADHYALSSPPERAEDYRCTAKELQTRGLTCFNRETQDQATVDSSKTHLPRFIFSSLLSMHMLYETLAHYRASYHVFIERFLNCIHLHQGVNTVVRSGLINFNGSTALHPFLYQFKLAGDKVTEGGAECDELKKVIDSSDLSPATVAACKSAADSLQWAFNMQANLPKENNTHAATAFPTLLTPAFIDVLRKHRPEAVLVLAYYGVLLHRYRRSWVIGDAGQFLVHLIANHLGSFWQEPMRWPLQAIRDEEG
ncbi:hypothetical protein G7Z17_g7634 [Cylindrodendrum hubeiense]|uniref:Zn(2)-C6 fungal-type domain-containing protein n=1 Tax=Cylindrodendrum hubeiense TaxID=595255 RepID=A0A9P5H2P4_9HYPO|nr:hypothetical protein G7Z17_g7634 [Cylindrodendrum hubeiense]